MDLVEARLMRTDLFSPLFYQAKNIFDGKTTTWGSNYMAMKNLVSIYSSFCQQHFSLEKFSRGPNVWHSLRTAIFSTQLSPNDCQPRTGWCPQQTGLNPEWSTLSWFQLPTCHSWFLSVADPITKQLIGYKLPLLFEKALTLQCFKACYL